MIKNAVRVLLFDSEDKSTNYKNYQFKS